MATNNSINANSTTPLPIVDGGTQVTSVTTAPASTAFAGWDANKNLSMNNILPGFTTVARSNGSTYTLTLASTHNQYYTGTGITGDKVVAPDTTTLVNGTLFVLVNIANTTLTLNASDGSLIATIPADISLELLCLNNAASTNTSWTFFYNIPQALLSTSSPTFAGLTLTNPYIAGAGGLHSIQYLTSGTAATYTKPSNVSSILVKLVGGGGGGGGSLGAATSISIGGAGGAGGFAQLYIASAASTYTYTIGAGGAGGTAGTNTGTQGGTTSFSASSLQATGGFGGAGGVSSTGAIIALSAGGAGGVGSNGNINGNGSPGTYSIFGEFFNSEAAAPGGATIFGGGALTTAVGTGVSATDNSGAGGSGGWSNSVSASGGVGGSGLIVVYEYA